MKTNKELYQSVFGTLHASGVFQFQDEETNMKRSRRLLLNRAATYLIMAAAILALTAGTVFAAVKLLTPSEVAQKYGNEALAEAFASEDAILINEFQEFEEYTITLLGMVSGKDLGGTVTGPDGEALQEESTNAIIAVEQADGEPFDIEEFPLPFSDRLIILPMISGFPDYLGTDYGFHSESLSFSDDHKVAYIIISLYNMEPFADHTLYLGVIYGGHYYSYQDPSMQEISVNEIQDQEGNRAFIYDEETGLFQRNELFQGSNALFELPVDPQNADPEKAQAIMKSSRALSEEELQELISTGKIPDISPNRTIDDLAELGEPLEGTLQILVPDEDGMVTLPGYTINYPDGSFAAGSPGQTVPMEFYMDYLFKDTETGIPKMEAPGGFVGNDQYHIDFYEVLTLNEDNTLTFQVYTKTTVLEQPTTVTVEN